MIFERINPCQIVVRHFTTFYNNKTDKICWGELVALLCIAAAFSTVSFFVLTDTTLELSKSLFSPLTILSGFLINSIVLLTGKKSEILKSDNSLNSDFRNLLFDTFDNISFGVLLCIITMCICTFIAFAPTRYIPVLGSVLFLGLFLLIHSMLLIVKRLHKIFITEIGT